MNANQSFDWHSNFKMSKPVYFYPEAYCTDPSMTPPPLPPIVEREVREPTESEIAEGRARLVDEYLELLLRTRPLIDATGKMPNTHECNALHNRIVKSKWLIDALYPGYIKRLNAWLSDPLQAVKQRPI